MPSLKPELQDKYRHLRQTIEDMGAVLVAFSGGVDSTLVLKVAFDVLGDRVQAVTALSPTFPERELDAVRQLSQEIGVVLRVVETDQLLIADFVKNDANRCFHCKTDLYSLLSSIQGDENLRVIVDGTNLDDLGEDRPGIRAARGWGVRSPLVECAIGKAEIRELAQSVGLSNWDKPAAACLSSRITRGLPITKPDLSRVERAEAFLLKQGFKQVRVRLQGELARIEVGSLEVPRLMEEKQRTQVVAELEKLGFASVSIDPDGYRAGGGNVAFPPVGEQA